MKKKSEEENKKDNTGWNAFLELRRQAQRGPAAGMTLANSTARASQIKHKQTLIASAV